MIYWLLYLAIDGEFLSEPHPFHFAYKETCEQVGKDLVQKYKYEKYRCVKEVRE